MSMSTDNDIFYYNFIINFNIKFENSSIFYISLIDNVRLKENLIWS